LFDVFPDNPDDPDDGPDIGAQGVSSGRSASGTAQGVGTTPSPVRDPIGRRSQQIVAINRLSPYGRASLTEAL